MAFFSKEEVVLFSPMAGVITYEGAPAVGAEVSLQVNLNEDPPRIEAVEVGEDGSFSLPEMTTSQRQILPSQFVAHQRIYVRYQGEQYEIWTMGKIAKGLYGELGGKPSGLRCELTSELRRVETPYGGLGTVCEWSEIEQ